MAKVIFKFNGTETLIQCQIEDKMKDICQKFSIKIQINIDKLMFIYGGDIINLDMKYEEIVNRIDKQNLRMNILVYENNDINMINEKERIIKSKDVICPKCGEKCLINIEESKVILNKCKNNHETIIDLKEYENTQRINENKIICEMCTENNKSNSYNNRFYRCGTCNKNICLLCKEKHNKEHIIIDYENKNYICNKHNESLVSYCEICRENLCIQCQMKHIISYMDIMPDIDKIRNKMKELKEIIEKFSKNLDNIINIFQNVKMYIEQYYIINNNIMTNYDINKRNYEIFNNVNNLNNIINNKMIKDIIDIINEEDIKKKFKKIYDINEIIKEENEKRDIEIKSKNEIKDDKEINLIYKTEYKSKQKIFGKDFVKNNSINIELIINGNKSKLIEEYELKKGENNIKLIIKNNLTHIKYMFYRCKSLYNINGLKYLDVSKCTDFSSIFYGCSSLSDIRAIENWDVSKCTDFSRMFNNCSSLSDIKPLEKWKVSNCTDFRYMFSGCSSLSDLKPLEKWDVSNCTNFGNMFSGCSSLSDLKPLEKWKVSNCTDFGYMFDGCSLLSDIKPLEKWDVSKCTDFSFMFSGCSSLVDREIINKKFK